jgi:hypothetical protein
MTKLWNGIKTAVWLLAPRRMRCPLCDQRVPVAQFTAHMWLDHADGT